MCHGMKTICCCMRSTAEQMGEPLNRQQLVGTY